MAQTTVEGGQSVVGQHLERSEWVEVAARAHARAADPGGPGFRMGGDHGTEKVRFPAPVPVGGRD